MPQLVSSCPRETYAKAINPQQLGSSGVYTDSFTGPQAVGVMPK